ncbi:MAG: cellulase family glycosylhydrolase [Candidatus Poribacteria bacterium]|nr:cellulase family glycosylhydrolase [Candidatus Poribacteria bacterium]
MNRYGILRLALTLLILFSGGQAAPPEPSPKSEPFILGCNLPWLDGRMGWDIAYHEEWGYGFDQPRVEAIFADLQEIGFTSVRWWLFADCRAGLRFDAEGKVTGVQPEVFDHLDIILNELCPKYGLTLYLCLLSSLVNSDHFGIITDPAIRQSYIEHAVKPLAQRYRDNPSLFAIDLMNEPEADIRGRYGNWTPKGTDEATIRVFLRECADAIHSVAPDMRVSAGSGCHAFENLQRGMYSSLGLDFYDFHTYNDTGHLPPAERLRLDAPCLIGEFNVTLAQTSDEVKQAEVVDRFLRETFKNGYAGAFFWCYEDISPDKRQANQPSYSLLRPDGTWKLCVQRIRQFSQQNVAPLYGKD